MGVNPDFTGYATKVGIKCKDGRTIMPNAFQHMDGVKVPLVWSHQHNDPNNVLGHAYLEARKDGVYAKAFFNGTPNGQSAKALVQHGDVVALSIFANGLNEKNKQVFHGDIRELSLVLSGANPGALIDNVTIAHGDGSFTDLEEEVIIYGGESLEHVEQEEEELEDEDALAHASSKTFQDVYDTLDEDQLNLLKYMLGTAVENAGSLRQSGIDPNNKGDLAHQEGTDVNTFDQNGATAAGPSLSHAQQSDILTKAREANGSFRETVLAHADEYGITNIEELFPDARMINDNPEWITRKMEWVEKFLNGARKVPFSKIKSMSMDLTHDEARAKGYIKATMKKDQFFAVAKRETTPQTIYKKQKLDRDDIVDTAGTFDVVAWLWVEMRFMLREEVARAALIGDGREIDDPDKIREDKIRPIARDDEFYTIPITIPTNTSPEGLVEAVIRSQDDYKGSSPTAYALQTVITDMLLTKDRMGRRLWRNKAELASELGVSDIVPVPILAGAKDGDDDIIMIIVNPSAYTFGATRGGEVTTFDDFDIDFNQYKYLIETRTCGALTEHKTAIVIKREGGGTQVNPTAPTFNSSTGVVTIPSVTGVVYKNDETNATLTAGAQTALAPGAKLFVRAYPNTGYYFAHNTDSTFEFQRPA